MKAIQQYIYIYIYIVKKISTESENILDIWNTTQLWKNFAFVWKACKNEKTNLNWRLAHATAVQGS